jgi:hypothetical protein
LAAPAIARPVSARNGKARVGPARFQHIRQQGVVPVGRFDENLGPVLFLGI